MKFDATVFAGIKALATQTEKTKRRESLKGKLKTFKYLSVAGAVYQFPATEVIADRFDQKLTALGQNPAEYKLLATKPRNSQPIQVIDLRIAVRRGNVALVANVKGSRMETVTDGENYAVKGTFTGTRLAWPHLSGVSDTQFLNAVRESDLAIWYE